MSDSPLPIWTAVVQVGIYICERVDAILALIYKKLIMILSPIRNLSG